MLDDMLPRANSVCFLALSGFGRRVHSFLLNAGLVAPCRAVSPVDARLQNARTY